MEKNEIVIRIDTDWIESLLETNTETAAIVLDILRQHDDTFFDYIDMAIREMFENWCRESGDPLMGDESDA
jgi:hypothetical protein